MIGHIGVQRCIDGTCRPVCDEDTDCGRHERCDEARRLCVPDPRPVFQCLANRDCDEGECVDGRCLLPCAGDAGCGRTASCIESFCVPRYVCLTNEDCDEEDSCVNGRCDSKMTGPVFPLRKGSCWVQEKKDPCQV